MQNEEKPSALGPTIGIVFLLFLCSVGVALEMSAQGNKTATAYLSWFETTPDPKLPASHRFTGLPATWGYKWTVCETTPIGPKYCWKK